jgi:ribose transport system ATP-binding protein
MTAAVDRVRGPPVIERSHDPLLIMRGICKSFGGTQALRGVDVTLHPGEVLALLGENGAGKSTLIKILAGVHAPDAGEIVFDGGDVTASAGSLPIAFIHQDLGLIDWMTVAENVCLTSGFARSRGFIAWNRSRQAAARALATMGIALDPDTRVNRLGRTERSLVAIARALGTDARVIVMDEPTASLPADEVSRLFAAIEQLRRRGIAIIYVSHRLEEIFSVADRVVVLRDGRVAGVETIADTNPADLIRMIVGRTTDAVPRPPDLVPAPVHDRLAHNGWAHEGLAREGGGLAIDDAMVTDVGPVSLRVAPGEIVGLTGLRGAGQELVGRALFGLVPLDQGRISWDGRTLALTGPAAAIRQGIRFASGDRTGESIVPGLSIRENFFLNTMATGQRALGRLRHRAEHDAARQLGRHVRLSPNDPTVPIEALSGGNQQKVVLGRWLHLRGRLLLLEDPTAGVDVGAKAEIYRLLYQALEQGLAIVLISTDFVEVAALCHRALVFSRGRIVSELSAPELTAGALLNAAAVTAETAAAHPLPPRTVAPTM